jgi:hypothetical protein
MAIGKVIRAVINGERPPRPEAIDFTPRIALDDLWSLMETCWAQAPDERPSGSEVYKAIRDLQGANTAEPGTANDQPFPRAEAQITVGRKHTCQYCNEGFGTKSRLYDHVTLRHMKTRE